MDVFWKNKEIAFNEAYHARLDNIAAQMEQSLRTVTAAQQKAEK